MPRRKGQHGGSRPARNPKPGLHSRPSALANLDGRTRGAKLMSEIEAALVEHVGGSPTAPQLLVIRSIALVCLRLDAAAVRVVEGRAQEHDDRHLASLTNCLRLGCAQLGMLRPEVSAPTLAAYLDGKAAAA